MKLTKNIINSIVSYIDLADIIEFTKQNQKSSTKNENIKIFIYGSLTINNIIKESDCYDFIQI